MIHHLTWDSDFFQLKIGKSITAQLTEQACKNLINEKLQQGYDLIYLFCDNAEREADKAIHRQDGLLADLKVTYQKEVPSVGKPQSSNISAYSGDLTPELLHLALASGHQSRFKRDIRLSAHYEALYTQWIQKSLDGTMADTVLVHAIEDRITGFVTLKNKNGEGQIGLIAVDENERGKGIGRLLLEASDVWYQQNGISHCTVVTQQDNLGACRLYENSDYRVERVERIYHV